MMPSAFPQRSSPHNAHMIPPSAVSPQQLHSKRLRLSHPAYSTGYANGHDSFEPHYQLAPIEKQPSIPLMQHQFSDPSIPASLAPSSFHRQHSSGTSVALEASLFDQPTASPLLAYSLQPSEASSSIPASAIHPYVYPLSSPSDEERNGKVLRTTSFSQPGFDTLSSPPNGLSLASPLHQPYDPHHLHFNFQPSHYPDMSFEPPLPAAHRGDSYMLGLQTATENSDRALMNEYDFSSPSHREHVPIGQLNRFTSDEQIGNGNGTGGHEPVKRAPSVDLTPSSVGSTASTTSSLSTVQDNYPHIVPPSRLPSSLPSSPATSPTSTPKNKSSKKRHRTSNADDGDKDEKSSVSSQQSTHSAGKDRHVNTAVKLITSNEESGDPLMDTKVRQIFYPRPDWPKPHRIRLIEVEDLKTGQRNVFAHGADVGSVVERKSNISRLFGKFTSPDEKLLMNVPGPHNHTVGQESNILTELGIRRFLETNKMKGQEHYKQWILSTLIPRLRQVGGAHGADEEVERGSMRGAPGVSSLGRGGDRERHGHLLTAGNGAYAVEGSVSPHSAPSTPGSYYSSDSYHSR